MRTRRFLDVLTVALLALLMIGHGSAFAQGNGKGKPPKDDGGGTQEPPATALPPIEYQIKFFYSPPGPYPNLQAMNNWGDCVGWAYYENGEAYGLLYNHGLEAVTDLNDIIDVNALNIDGLPPGSWIQTAYAINDFGAIVGSLGSTDNVRRGYILNTLSSSPMLSVLPGTSPFRINENGDVLGNFIDDDGNNRLFLFNPGIYGPADAEPEVIPFAIASYNLRGDLNNPFFGRSAQVIARIDAGNGSTDSIPFRYTRGGGVELLDEVGGVKNDGFHAINDAGLMTGWTNIEFNKRPKRRSYVTRFFDSTSMEILPNSENIGGASGINNAGDLAISNNSSSHFLYHSGDDGWGLVDLSKLLVGATDSDTVLWSEADYRTFIGISERDATTGFGMIAGWVSVPDSGRHFFIMTPRLLP